MHSAVVEVLWSPILKFWILAWDRKISDMNYLRMSNEPLLPERSSAGKRTSGVDREFP